jgi:hypothetical protein
MYVPDALRKSRLMCGRTAHSAQGSTDIQIPRIPIPPAGSNPARWLDYARLRARSSKLDYARLRARSSKLDARSKAYSTPARARPTSPLRPGPALLPLRRRLIQLAASSTKAACRRFVPRSHLFKWCRARRGQVPATGYACAKLEARTASTK